MTVTIVHPHLGESTCSESAVRLHERNGWKRKRAAKKSEGTAPKKSEGTAPKKSEGTAPAKKAPAPVADDPTTTKSPTAGEES